MMDIALKPDLERPGYYILETIRSLDEAENVRIASLHHVWRPPTDVFETEEAVQVRVEIAGMDENDINIVLDGRFLLIRGVRADVMERRAYHQMEIRFGEFSTEIELPVPVAVLEIEALYSNGFLNIRLPKARPVKIDIE